MINKYQLLKNDDDLESNFELSNQIELICTDEKKTQDCCSICLEANNNTSIELECGCRNKFHSNCIKELKKHNIKKCPLCQKNINNENDNEISDFFVGILVSICLLIIFAYVVTFFSIFFINPIKYIIAPSETKYCDNIYYQCEYYPVKAVLINNTINENFYDFNIKYQLSSSYKYYNYKTNQSETCTNLESHEFITYPEADKVSKKSIGIEKNIFVPFDKKKSCKLHYKFYNPRKFILNALTLLNFIWLLPLGVSFFLIKIYIEDDENLQNINNIYMKRLIKINYIIIMSIHALLQFSYTYYYFFK